MKTLHIMLASGENLPNLIPAIAPLPGDPRFKADAALIVTSADMRTQAQKLKLALEHSGVKSTRIFEENCPSYDLEATRQWADEKAEKITAEYRDYRRILNITGGTKLMTIAFLEAFRRRDAEIIYCDTKQDRIEYVEDRGRVLKLPDNALKLETYLAAQGYRLKDENIDVINIEARKELTRKLAQAASRIGSLIDGLNLAFSRHKPIGINLLNAEERALIDEFKARGLLRSNFTLQNGSPAHYLCGGWLEEWCWIVGKELEKDEAGKRLESDRWGVGLEIEPFSASDKGIHINELDAVYIHRNRMLLIECKTSARLKPMDQNILYKLETTSRQFGGRLNAKWLLTMRDIQPDTTTWKRAKLYGIEIIGPKEIGQLKEKIRGWMTWQN